MPAVVRVKRRIDEESVPAFVLNGKKRRIDGTPQTETTPLLGEGAAGKDEISTVLKFAGTMHEQDDTAISQYVRLTKDEARELVQQKTRGKPLSAHNHTERARAEMRQSLHESRFRVVNCLRTTLDADASAGDDAPAKELTIVDIEKQDLASSTTTATNQQTNSSAGVSQAVDMPSTSSSAAGAASAEFADSDTGYVYDFYLPENEQQAEAVDLMDDNYLSVRAFDDLIYEDRFNDEEDDYDSEDSNQENQPGNEYPDEDEDGNDSDESEGTRQIRLAVENFVFDDDNDDDEVDIISSEDEDVNPYQDPYVHSIDLGEAQDADCEFDVDYCDVNNYGMAYARYKKRVLKQLNNAEKEEEDDEDDDDDSDYEDDNRSSDSSSSIELYHSASENET